MGTTARWILLGWGVSWFVLIGSERPIMAQPLIRVTTLRVPQGGIQPQVAVDESGTIHAIYYRDDVSQGNILYVRSTDGGATFSAPIRVNSQEGSAIALGNVRGAHLAVGKNGRVHVAWMGSSQAMPRGPHNQTPMLYSRINDAETVFEPQRNMIQEKTGLDGGGSVAADSAGNVYVTWHAPDTGPKTEANRRVWVARSSDEGESFIREVPAFARPTGACGCCGMRAFADRNGTLYILYRSAEALVNRDMYLLMSRNRGIDFNGVKLHEWNIGQCVVSTSAFSEGPKGVLATWETRGQVYYAPIDPNTFTTSSPIPAPGVGNNRKHPAVASNDQGEVILAWTEGAEWGKGGSVMWQVFDTTSRPLLPEPGQADGVPPWSVVAVFARPDGGFTVVY